MDLLFRVNGVLAFNCPTYNPAPVVKNGVFLRAQVSHRRVYRSILKTYLRLAHSLKGIK